MLSVPVNIIPAALPICFLLMIGLLLVLVSITSASLLSPTAAMPPGSSS